MSAFDLSPAGQSGSSVAGLRVLVIAESARPRLVRFLGGQGYDVTQVAEVEAAVRLLPDLRPDVILIAARRAADACSRLQAIVGEWVPVVAVVGGSAVADRIAALSAGADQCLGTPYDLRELSARLHAVTRRNVALADRPDGEPIAAGPARTAAEVG